MNMYVSNLNFNIREEDLRQLFSQYGEVSSASIIMDKMTGRSRGFGFVEMADEAAKQAIAELDNSELDGRNIKVAEARPREDRPARSNNNPFRNNNSGGGYKKSW